MPSAPLSPASIERLRVKWQADYDEWAKRSLADRDLVYAWADGVYVKAGLERVSRVIEFSPLAVTENSPPRVISLRPLPPESGRL